MFYIKAPRLSPFGLFIYWSMMLSVVYPLLICGWILWLVFKGIVLILIACCRSLREASERK